MAFPEKVDYVIVGAGIHGLSTAWHLAAKLKAKGKGDGSKIVVIDKDSMNYDGYIYQVISEGYGSMLPYKDISVEDRWRIVSYIRALTYDNREGN